MGIEAVLFDYTGVMTADFAVPSGDVPFDVDALFLEMVGAMTEASVPHPWHELERGDISLEAFIEHIERAVPGSGAAFAATSEFNVMANLPLRTDRVELAQSLRDRGLHVGLVTNNVAEWEPLWRPAIPDGVFEVIVDSSAVRCRKPDAEMYELALTGLGGVEPDRAVFIDDFEWNVKAAVDLGMVGIHSVPDLDLSAAIDQALAENSSR